MSDKGKTAARDDFAIFILSHGRANNIHTLEALKVSDYRGKWFILCDDEDETLDDYKRKYKEHVVVFNKDDAERLFDTMQVNPDKRAIVYARNVCYDVAREKGLKYFLELDDDFVSFQFRFPKGDALGISVIQDFDRICDAMCEFLENTDADTIALAQGGDFIGGLENPRYKAGLIRKAMNSFFCCVNRRLQFDGMMNEDVTMYTHFGSIGKKIFTFTHAMLVQLPTQSLSGGMSDSYTESGTYMKTFYSVMAMPSCVSVGVMGDKHKRIHHAIKWDYCVPKILNERYKKA